MNKETYERAKLNIANFSDERIRTDTIIGSATTGQDQTIILGGAWTPPASLDGTRDPQP